MSLATKNHSSGPVSSDTTSSFQTMCLIRDWLDVCIRTHEACSIGRDDAWIPTRLLELSGFREDTKLRLRSQFQDEDIRYLTLSHCWGHTDSQTTKLTAKTLVFFHDSIALAELPQTFRDAVEITRELGFRYLWIDCMCIFQEDPDDWRREAALMSKVYANSRLNIAAASATDSSQGCFRDRDLSRVLNYIDGPACDDVGPQSRVLTPSDMWSHEVEEAPLHQRGWVLQERVLSPRVVHFAEKQVY
jgi:hypothetical protein